MKRWMMVGGVAGAILFAQAAQAADQPARTTRGVRVLEADTRAATPPPPVPAVQPPPAPEPPPPPPIAAPTPAPPPSAPTPDAPTMAKCDRAYPTADLGYVDTVRFDQQLSAALIAATDPRGVVIDTPPFAPDTALPRLVGWLSTIQSSGGQVSRRDIVCTRAFSLSRMLRNLFSRPEKPDIYLPARNYDAVFWIEQATGQVRQVQFQKRAAN